MNKPVKHIAVNTRLLLSGNLEGIGRFSEEILRRLVHAHPEVRFSFFFDRPYDERFLYGPNVEPHVISPPARHPFLFIAWFEYAVAAKLRRLQPDVFFSPDGYLSLRSRIPQVAVFHDLAFEHFPGDVKKLEAWHYRRYFPRFARKARQLIAVSEFTKQDIVQHYGVPGDKITVAYNACAEHFHPIPPAEKAAVRQRFSEDQPYFHTVGAIQPRKNLVNLIAAFDRFKAESGAPHKLLVVGRKAWNFEKVIHSYATSEHKSDIVFTGYVSDTDLNLIYAASAGLCYVPYFEGFGLPIMEAMACEVPVITANVTSMPEVAGDAALLVDPHAPEEIAAALLRLVREADLASQLVDSGKARQALFSWDRSAERVWNVLANG
ncbi:MAG: glycosyltransferase family 1 protein [Bacteroidota bacterium]